MRSQNLVHDPTSPLKRGRLSPHRNRSDHAEGVRMSDKLAPDEILPSGLESPHHDAPLHLFVPVAFVRTGGPRFAEAVTFGQLAQQVIDAASVRLGTGGRERAQWPLRFSAAGGVPVIPGE